MFAFLHRRPTAKPMARKITRLELEELGARILLAVRIWTNMSGNGLWSTPMNWTGNEVPGNGDTAKFNNTSVTPSTIDDMFGGQVAEVVIENTYMSTITVGRNLNVTDKITQSAGAISVSAGKQVTVRLFDMAGGQITGSGSLVVNGTPNNIGIMNVNQASGIGSTGGLVIGANASMNINAELVFFGGGVLKNEGLVSWLNGDIVYNVSGTINNHGTFNAVSDFTMFVAGAGPGVFNNYGIFRKVGGLGTTIITNEFNNQTLAASPPALVEVLTGKLRLDSSGQHSSTFAAGAIGATIEFYGGLHTLNTNATFVGPGWVSVTNGAELQIPVRVCPIRGVFHKPLG